MSTLITPVNPAGAPPPDPPIVYGYREIVTKRPDGTYDNVRIPLTLEDCLHPEMGDVLMESSLHDEIRMYLAGVFRWKTAHDPSALVLSDTGVYWDKPSLRHHAPDVAVIFGVTQRKANYTRFDVAQEKTRPRLIVEIVSPNMRANDVNEKLIQYQLACVPTYVILDKAREEDSWQVRSYQWTPTHYLDMPKDEHGRVWLEPVGVWLEVQGQNVQCRDGATGELIGDYTQSRQEACEQRAQAQMERARADQETARADAELQARLAAEARLQELEEELARLRNPGTP
jgi:colicin import membrane protein